MITATIELNRIGCFIARIVDTCVYNTGHEISEDSGFFYVRSILNDKPLSHKATQEKVEKDIAAEWMIFAGAHKPETSHELDERWEGLTFPQKIAVSNLRHELAKKELLPLLKYGDRIRARKTDNCTAKEATFIFARWSGNWIVSISGLTISPASVYSINGEVFRV